MSAARRLNNECTVGGGGGLAGLTCVQDVWQDGDYTQLAVLTGLLHHVFIQDLTETFPYKSQHSSLVKEQSSTLTSSSSGAGALSENRSRARSMISARVRPPW